MNVFAALWLKTKFINYISNEQGRIVLAEGPQVLRRTEWLHRHLAGYKVHRCHSIREDIPEDALAGRRVKRAFCKGKNIFIEFDGQQYLHNHILMSGKWSKLDGALLFLPPRAWLGLYVGKHTICNIGGQKLKLASIEQVEQQMASLGPDAMAMPYPAAEICKQLLACNLPISEALLQQSVLAGVGNIAKSEILFRARLDPRLKATFLMKEQIDCLIKMIPAVLWDSYKVGGRWECQVYQRRGKKCHVCGIRVQSIALPPSKRATYFCPKCQRGTRLPKENY